MKVFRRSLASLALFFGLGAPLVIGGQVHEIDPAKVVGSQKCGECHKYEVEAWKTTPHFATFDSMHRSADGQKIAAALGIRRIKSESLCLTCHYTVQKKGGGEAEPISGVSCESCHGAAQDWVNVHNDKKLSREERRAKSEPAGMIRPDDLYAVAANCYQCHLVPNEKLVNVGGHTAGSKGFELVSWSQGMVRHNFLTPEGEEGKVNKEDDANRRRMMFAIGTILDLEYSLRGVASATEKATYGITMAQRVAGLKKRIEEIQKAAPTDEMAQIITTVSGVALKLNNQGPLTEAADKVAELGKKFSSTETGGKLAGLDPMIPSPAQYRGKPYQP
ncbi:MAG: cytochrome c family protein [Chthoniobacterales bacterium]